MERFLLCSAGMPNQSMYHVVHQWCTASNPHEIYRNISNLNVFLANIQSILQETSRNGFTVVSLVGFLVGFRLYIIDGPNGRPERVHYWRWRSVKSRYSVTHKAGGKALISGGHQTGSWPKFICSVNDSAQLIHLPVKWHLSSCKL